MLLNYFRKYLNYFELICKFVPILKSINEYIREDTNE